MTLHNFLKKRKISGKIAAELLRVSETTISLLRRRKLTPSRELAEKIKAWSEGEVKL